MSWLGGWIYRKSITLSRASGSVANYQMKLLVGESSGATGEDVDCGGKVLSSFNDLRFTNADGVTLLDYWIESVTGTTPNQLATVWIEFDSIGTGATTFYMYYGKSSAAAYSNGTDTFIVFDNFERGNDGDAVGGSWSVITGSVKISTDHAYGGTRCMKLVGGATWPNVQLPVTYSANIAVRCRLWKEDASGVNYLCMWDGTSGYTSYTMVLATEKINYYDTTYREVGTGVKDAWMLMENNDFNFPTNFDMWYAGAEIKANAVPNNWGAGGDKLRFFTFDAAGIDSYVDDVIVRNWRDTEPAWGSWGSEESIAKGAFFQLFQ